MPAAAARPAPTGRQARPTGTVQGSSAGFPRARRAGRDPISSGESSGAVRSDGSSRTASAGLPAWIVARVLAGAANGCGRADRSAWLVAADREAGVLGPQAQPIAGGPEPVQHQHGRSLQRRGMRSSLTAGADICGPVRAGGVHDRCAGRFRRHARVIGRAAGVCGGRVPGRSDHDGGVPSGA